ncbi:MAG: dTDP-4-dehydrorhamnose 3,5-epimerase [Opitutales bacterium]
MNYTNTFIEGLVVLEPKVFADNRGYFFESYSKKELLKAGIDCDFVQDNQSSSTKGTIRGLHAQLGEFAQAKLIRVLSGTVLDVAVDIRENSPTFGKHFAIELSAENKKQLFIPRGFLHGFSVLSDSAEFFYKCDNFYHKEAEFGLRYDDEYLAIDWKVDMQNALVSDKDKVLGGFKDAFSNRL